MSDSREMYLRHYRKGIESEVTFEDLMSSVSWVDGHTNRGKLNRKVAYIGEEGRKFRYSGTGGVSTGWDPNVKKVRDYLAKVYGVEYNFCLANYYPDGQSSIGWHSDSLRDLVPGSTITSVSYGATRGFLVKPKKSMVKEGKVPDYPMTKLNLEDTDVLVMSYQMHQHLLHSVPKRVNVAPFTLSDGSTTTARISLTFRVVKD